MKQDNESLEKQNSLTDLVQEVKGIIQTARTEAVRSVDFCRVQMYWHIGKRIFEVEQQGKERADYGTYLIKNLAQKLQPEYGTGFGIRQLERARQFYRIYPNASTVRTQLNWTQYKLLIAIQNPDKREYYELEAVNNGWKSRELERQINSMLYERLLLSNNKENNRLLRCFVVIELKTHKLTHQDLGQLQLYVNYYDRFEKTPDENPTIGILLCTDKNDTAVRLALPENNKTILANQYQLYLPTSEQLLNEIKQIEHLKNDNA